MNNQQVWVADPGAGKLKYTKEEFSRCWISSRKNGENTGVALLLEPTPEFYAMKDEDETIDRKGFRFLYSYLLPYQNLIGQLLLGLLLGSMIQLMLPFLTQSIVDFGINNQNLSFIYLILIAQLMLSFSSSAVEFIRGWTQMDEHDDRYTPENWIKANPILEFDRDALENLIPIAHTARDMGGEDLRDFLVKQLNMWMQWSNSLYIKDIASWKACAVLKSLKDFRGSKCYVGVDLSSGGDLTSIAIVIPFMVEDTKKYFVHTHSFIPSSRVDEHIKTDKVPYDVWIEKGLVTVTETLGGIKTDYKYIITVLLKITGLDKQKRINLHSEDLSFLLCLIAEIIPSYPDSAHAIFYGAPSCSQRFPRSGYAPSGKHPAMQFFRLPQYPSADGKSHNAFHRYPLPVPCPFLSARYDPYPLSAHSPPPSAFSWHWKCWAC